MNGIAKLLLGAVLLFGSLSLMPSEAAAQQVSSCSTIKGDPNYHPQCSNSCDLPEYFQYIYKASYRPFLCNRIPSAFWAYQTQVGEVSANGKSSSGSASSASAAAASGSSGVSAAMLTPTQRVSIGSAALHYAPSSKKNEAIEKLNAMSGEEAPLDYGSAPPLEKAVWIKLLGTLGNKDATAQLASIRVQASGIMAGTDLYSNEYLRFGLLGSVSDISVDIHENNNELDVTAWKVGGTGTLEVGKWYLDGLATHSWEKNSASRTVDINGRGDLRDFSSKFTNRRINAAFETGFRLNAGRLMIQPLAGVDLNWLKQAEVVEQGNSSASIITAKNTIFTGSSKLGVNLSSVILLDKSSIVPTIGGYWGHRFGELENANRISTDQGVSYQYVGTKPPLDLFNLYASLMVNFDQKLAVSASYHGAFNRFERYHSGNIALRLRF
nr:autotransporter outer membrane beta-barrel domain-containing protein [uncultured Cohaesibacter sp.]